jgi:hypothetical protein
LFEGVFAAIEKGIHVHSGVNGKTTRGIQINPRESYLAAMQVAERTSCLAEVKLADGRSSRFLSIFSKLSN